VANGAIWNTPTTDSRVFTYDEVCAANDLPAAVKKALSEQIIFPDDTI